MYRFSAKDFFLRILQGALIGAGAILPGISGGVLAVVFGIYRPLMELLTHPKRCFGKYFPILLPVLIGWAAGFFGGSGLIFLLFRHSETVATCLFVGLILGTVPSLWREAGEQGRGKNALLTCVVCFLALSAVLLYAQYGAFYEMKAGFLGFLFCGALWGLSFIVPGMTSSSILMAVGLFTPMAEGIASFDMAVILPWLTGMGGVILLLARFISYCFRAHYAVFYHGVIGIVLASTVTIVPFSFASGTECLMCAVCTLLGAVLAWLSTRMQTEEAH